MRKRRASWHRPAAKTLHNYRLDSAEFGPDTRCEGLEPFDALSLDEFLGGPGAPPLSQEDRRHLRHAGLDFKEAKDPANRKAWLPHERQRWQRSKRLRSLIKKGLVCCAVHEASLYRHHQQKACCLYIPLFYCGTTWKPTKGSASLDLADLAPTLRAWCLPCCTWDCFFVGVGHLP